MEKLVESHPIIMEVTLYVALGVNPGSVKNHLGALEIILAFHEAPKSHPALQIILDFCIPKKELAKTCSQIAFIYFQSHS
jgi:hypothetical protein